jgi:hypothetical protein
MNEIVFVVHGEPYKQIRDWQQRTDLLIIKHQIETRGRALIVRLHGQKGMQHIERLPDIGEAVPWYGTTGMGYNYVFTPLTDGCALWVENQGSHSMIYPDAIQPLAFHLPDRIMTSTVPAQSEWRASFEDTGQSFIFRITGRDYEELAAWPDFDEPLEAYSYRFTPTTVGDLITITHHASGASLRMGVENP